MQEKKIENIFYRIGCAAVIAVGVLFLLWKLTGFTLLSYLPPCVFHVLTGLYCPGCGGTRAVVALLDAHVVKSFFYYPMVPYAAIVCGWFLISQTIERVSRGHFPIGLHFRTWYLWIALLLILGNCLIKNVALVAFHVDLLAF